MCVDNNDENMVRILKSLVLHEGRMLEETNETSKSHIFKTRNWYLSAGYEDVQGEIQWLGNNSRNVGQGTLEEDTQKYRGVNMEFIAIKLDFLEYWLKNPGTVDCSKERNEKIKFFMEELQQHLENNDDNIQQKMQGTMREAPRNRYPDQLIEYINQFPQIGSDMCQLEDKLAIEIEELRKIMLEETQQQKYVGQRRMKENTLQMVEKIYVSKEGGRLQHKF